MNDFQKIKDVIDYKQFYSSLIELDEGSVSGSEYVLFCCFHEDKNKKSLTVNIENGLFHCFACDAKGDVFHFYQRIRGVNERQALIEIGNMCSPPIVIGGKRDKETDPRPVIDESYADECFEYLEGNDELRELLYDKKKIEKDVRRKYRIGFDKRMNRFTIPIYENGKLVNIRKYSFNPGDFAKIFSHTFPMSKKMIEKEKEKEEKKKNYKAKTKWAYGEYRIYGHDEVKERKDDPIYFCEGEWDKITLSQFGFLAVTGTAGANAFNEDYINLFNDRDVIVVFDVDDPGKKGALKILSLLHGVVRSIKNINLPYLDGSKADKDISDLFFNERPSGLYTIEEFNKLVKEYEVYNPISFLSIKDDEEEVIKIENLSDLYLEKYQGKKIEIEFMITGNIYASYTSPSVIKLAAKTCKKIKKCPNEAVCLQGTELTIQDREYYGSCAMSDTQIEAMHKKKICLYNQPGIRIDVLKRKPIKEHFITDKRILDFSYDEDPLAEEKVMKQPISDVRLFYDGDQPTGINTYKAIGYANSLPKNQQLIFSTSHIEPIFEEWEKFTVNDEAIKQLNKFKDMKLSIDMILADITDHVTKIYGRTDILTLMLLTYLSPLHIVFNSRKIIGILNTTIIGDSGTGKTEIFKTLQEYIGLGDYVRGETAGRTGIIYGINDHKSKGWEIKIGVYIQQNRRLLCVDEIQRLEKEDIIKFNQGMDQGQIKIDRISSGIYESLTRLITLCNPHRNTPLMEHRRPCLSLKRVFDETFIRRMDAFGFCSSVDFDAFEADAEGYTLYNRPVIDQTKQLVTKEMIRTLVYLMWNIKKEQIIFTEDATKNCLKYTTRLAKKFGDSADLQILPSSDFRNTLAKASVGFAALSIGFEDNYSKLVITNEHVDRAYAFFDEIYSSPNCALNYYSIEKRADNILIEEEFYSFVESYHAKVRDEQNSSSKNGILAKFIGLFQKHDRLKKDQICEYLSLDREQVNQKIRFLNSFNFLGTDKKGIYGKQKFHLMIHKCIEEKIFNEETMALGSDEADEVF